MKALNELCRLRAAINGALDEPARAQAILGQLHVGQTIKYFDEGANSKRFGKILESRRKVMLIIDRDEEMEEREH